MQHLPSVHFRIFIILRTYILGYLGTSGNDVSVDVTVTSRMVILRSSCDSYTKSPFTLSLVQITTITEYGRGRRASATSKEV